MSTAIATSPRPGLDLHRRSYSPVPSPLPVDGPFDLSPPVPLSTIAVPSLSDIPEERTPRTTGSSHGLDGTAFDLEAQLKQKPFRRRDVFIPRFHNGPPFLVWLRRSWIDILTQLTCLFIAEMIYVFATPLMPRYFPLYPGIWTSSWGLKYGQPLMDEYINTFESAVISFVVPLGVMGILGLWWYRDFWETDAAVSTLCLSKTSQPHKFTCRTLRHSKEWTSIGLPGMLTEQDHGPGVRPRNRHALPIVHQVVHRRAASTLPLRLRAAHATAYPRSWYTRSRRVVHSRGVHR